MMPTNTNKAIFVSAAILLAAGVFAVRSAWFGTRATMADRFPQGFAGTHLDPNGDEAQSILGTRADGTPIFSPDTIRFEDAVDGVVELPRPAVSLAEADRLGHDESLRTPNALTAYCMRGPIAAGLTDTDGRWLVELAERHEDPAMRAKAIGFIGLAIGLEVELGVNDYAPQTRQRMVESFAAAILSDNLDIQRSALAVSDSAFWAEEIPGFVDMLRRVVRQDNQNSPRAAYALEQAFNIREPE